VYKLAQLRQHRSQLQRLSQAEVLFTVMLLTCDAAAASMLTCQAVAIAETAASKRNANIVVKQH